MNTSIVRRNPMTILITQSHSKLIQERTVTCVCVLYLDLELDWRI